MPKPVVVLIRDGWGYRKEEDFNGPVQASTPYTDHLMSTYPNTLIDASGEAVGLPDGFIGNSEVGHLTIGTGRVNKQMFLRINDTIEDESFYSNAALNKAIDECERKNSQLHLMGIVQEEAVHGHTNHLKAILELCKRRSFHRVLIHVFSDGRDSPVHKTKERVSELLDLLNSLGFGKIATIVGRYYSMDRDKRWDRTKLAYDSIACASSKEYFEDPLTVFTTCYERDETDEFIVPQCAKGYTGIAQDDSVIFYNYRTDRTRQLTKAMIEEEFEGWERKPLDIHFVAMTEFYSSMNPRAEAAFKETAVENCLGEVLSKNNIKQLRISETEKYAHVTFFFNGQIEEPYPGEDRILVHSPKVATYDLKPEMSVDEIGDKLLEVVDQDTYDVIIVNYVNGDMVGHTGVMDAVVSAVQAVDRNVEKLCKKVLEKQGVLLVFADHGNCEEEVGRYKTSHTINPVQFILVSDELKEKELITDGGLCDIAPTVLSLLTIEQPKEMSGKCLYK